MADISMAFAAAEGRSQGSSGRPDRAEMARVREALAQGSLPAPLPDDRALARMLGLSLAVGLLMTAGAVWGVLHLLA